MLKLDLILTRAKIATTKLNLALTNALYQRLRYMIYYLIIEQNEVILKFSGYKDHQLTVHEKGSRNWGGVKNNEVVLNGQSQFEEVLLRRYLHQNLMQAQRMVVVASNISL